MELRSPTGNWNVRNDDAGHGYYGAPRGNRLHTGVDLLCVPGQDILAPISGTIVRVAYPYAGDLKWTGFLIRSAQMEVKVFYARLFRHYENHLPLEVAIGRTIATAQDISSKYPDQGMKPHVHLEVRTFQLIDPVLIS